MSEEISFVVWSPLSAETIHCTIHGEEGPVYGPMAWRNGEALALLDWLRHVRPAVYIRGLRFERTNIGITITDNQRNRTYQLDDEAIETAIWEIQLHFGDE